MAKCVALLLLFLLSFGCGKNSSEKLTTMSEEFVLGSLAFSPSAATAAGLHEYQGLKLDEMLDDNSPANLDKQMRFYEKIKERLAQLKQDQLSPEDRADLVVMQDQIAL